MENNLKKDKKLICGLIMPISEIDNCSAEHWDEVRNIIEQALEDTKFVSNLVSSAKDVGTIHKRIIDNIYNNPIVVCDVSGKNPNVMFELGLRLAFDKPTVIIKDDKTDYSFDTSVIEHVYYPRDLNFHAIVKFQKNLIKKIEETYLKSTTDDNYSTFLKNFGSFKVVKIDTEVVTKDEFIIEKLENLTELIESIKYENIYKKDIYGHNFFSRANIYDLVSRVAKYIYDHENSYFITKRNLIADTLNISPESLSRVLRRFTNEGLIDSDNKTIDKIKLEKYFKNIIK
jgi:hypothetical protein